MAKGKRMLYSDPGRLSGKIQGYQVAISHNGKQHFRAIVNGEHYDSLSQKFVEEELGIPVHVKRSGSQVGYPSESVPRAVWRHLADRYNDFKRTVSYESV